MLPEILATATKAHMRLVTVAFFFLNSAMAIQAADPAATPPPVAPNPAVAPAGTNAAPAAPKPAETPPSAADIQSLQSRADAGDADAEFDLSMLYFNGSGVPKDPARAYDLSVESAIQGNAIAARDVAVCYRKGIGAHLNVTKESAWLEKSAQLGWPVSERLLGVDYQFGDREPRNVYKGTEWLRKAALAGDEEAEARYGDNLMCGIGTDKDLEQGFAYLLWSRLPFANYLLAHAYATGLYVKTDPVMAWGYLQLAPPNDEKVKALSDTLGKQLTEAQKGQGVALVPKLKAVHEQNAFDAPNFSVTLDNGSSVTLKFDKPFGAIVVPLMVQGKGPFYFIVDTGCSISLLDPKTAEKIGLTGDDYFPMRGIGSKLGLARVEKDISFSAPGLRIDHVCAAVLPELTMDEYLGRPIDGILGGDILKHFVVQIDYLKKELTLALPGKLAPDPKAVSLPMQLHYNLPYIPASLGDPAGNNTGDFLIDTGALDTGEVSRKFRLAHPSVPVQSGVQSGAMGFGGLETSDVGRAQLNLAGFSFHDVFLSFVRDALKDSVSETGGIGEHIWRRFTFTIDYPGKKIFLLPNEKFKDPFEFTYGGAAVKAGGADYRTFIIYTVVPDSPAESVDLRVGDQITQIDQKPTPPMTLEELEHLLAKEGTHELHVLRDGKDLVIQFPVFDPFAHPDQVAKYVSSAPPSSWPKVATMTIQWKGKEKAIYPDSVIFRAGGLNIGDIYTPYAMRRAVLALWNTGLFHDVVLTAPKSEKTTNVTFYLEANPLATKVTLTGLQPQEEASLRSKLTCEEGKRVSHHDLFEDAALIHDTLAVGNATARTVNLAVTCDDGEVLQQDVAIPKAGP